MNYTHIQQQDQEIFDLLKKEEERQVQGLVMIPSENYASTAVLEANGSIFNNKYSEGYPGKRYYEGQDVADVLESVCQARALKLFKAEGYSVNVQPYSGSPANIEVYTALLNFGDTILAMDLSHGVHLTHGAPANFSGKNYNFVHYRFDPATEQIDYELMEKLALEHKPKMIISGFTAYPRKIDFKRVHDIAKKAGAISMADISHIAGLIAGGVHASPFPFTDIVTTTTHKTLRGPRGAVIFSKPEYSKAIDSSVFPGMQGGPHEHAIAGYAVAFAEAEKPGFAQYAEQVVKNASVLAHVLMNHGLKLVSNGTDNHLILVDLRNFGIGRGYVVAKALDAARIYMNRNSVFDDQSSPFFPSGLRMGTPALTTRGMKEGEMEQIGLWIAEVTNEFAKIELPEDKAARTAMLKDFKATIHAHPLITKIRDQVTALAVEFPAPGIS
ncbi:MAG TPA: serine hydroxymethyltransferase [Patescibacteria group bacterium]|nr:serine hydroxymethyltransferase [Patescibacteria group bacterium]